MNTENVRIEIGTHCSWEELHLSQVLVTTQMICRYYWNLGVENRQRSNEASQTENTQKRTLADNTNADQHILTTSAHIKMSPLLEKDEDDKIEKAIWLHLWHNSFRCDMSLEINRHFCAAGRGRGGLKGRERWGGRRETVSEVTPPCKSKSSMLLTCTLIKCRKTGLGSRLVTWWFYSCYEIVQCS